MISTFADIKGRNYHLSRSYPLFGRSCFSNVAYGTQTAMVDPLQQPSVKCLARGHNNMVKELQTGFALAVWIIKTYPSSTTSL